jgi:hypothetical protein
MVRYMKGAAVLTLLILLTSSFPSNGSVLAQADNTLTQSYRVTLQGDVLSAGVGLRGEGVGEISIEDLPPSASIVKAFLYWGTIGTSSTFNSLLFNDQVVTGALIGISGNTCWEGPPGALLRNFVFRADVTGRVQGNGTYSLEGLPNDLEAGNDSQGASLVLIYAVPGYPFRTVVINDGAVTLDTTATTYTDTIEGFDHTEPITYASVTYIMGDGQSEWQTGDVTFNGVDIATNVFTGVDGEHWGTLTFDVTALNPTSPSTTTIDNEAPFGTSPDCLLWAATVFSATSPPPAGEITNTLAPFFNESYQGAVTSAGVGMRGQGAGEITITNVPEGSSVIRAFLYWATIGTTGTYDILFLDGERVEGERIATSGNTCWESPHQALQFYNFVYRADVTELVHGSGTYQITGLPASLNEGNDSQGASLVVIYANLPGEPYNTILINDGAVTLDIDFNSYTDTLTGFDVSEPLVDATITYIMGDGQSRWESGNVYFNQHPIGTNIFNGVDGAYWGTIRFNITHLGPTDPTTTTINNEHPDNGVGPDCLLWVGTVFSVTPTQPEYVPPIYLPLLLQSAAQSQ